MSAVLEQSVTEQRASAALSSAPQPARTRLRLFYFAERVSARVHRLMRAVYAGFWLGLLNDEDIGTIISRFYDGNDLYHSADHNLHGLFPWEVELLRDHFKECRSVVVAAAGGGREMIALAQTGLGVEGFECNPRLVEKCKEFIAQAGVSGRILDAEPDQVPSDLQMFDGAIVGCGALGHITGRAKRIKFLSDLKGHLHRGAPLLLSVGRRPSGSHYHNWIYQITRTIRFLRRSDNSFELGDDPLDLYTHRFVRSDVETELQAAGFKIVVYREAHEIYVVAQA
jgi:hypothetical protein